MKQSRTHNPKGEELSQMFVCEGGLLSTYHNDHECEVVGFQEFIFGCIILGKVK